MITAATLFSGISGLIPILEAVRYTVGLGKNQMERINAAKALLAAPSAHSPQGHNEEGK